MVPKEFCAQEFCAQEFCGTLDATSESTEDPQSRVLKNLAGYGYIVS